MPLQRLETLAAGELPDLESFVVAGGDKKPRVGAPRHVGDA